MSKGGLYKSSLRGITLVELLVVLSIMVLLMAVHFRNRPVLQGDTRLVDLTHILDVLAKEGNDAQCPSSGEGSQSSRLRGRPPTGAGSTHRFDRIRS